MLDMIVSLVDIVVILEVPGNFLVVVVVFVFYDVFTVVIDTVIVAEITLALFVVSDVIIVGMIGIVVVVVLFYVALFWSTFSTAVSDFSNVTKRVKSHCSGHFDSDYRHFAGLFN